MPLLALALGLSDHNHPLMWIFMALAEIELFMNWAPVSAIVLYTIAPAKVTLENVETPFL